MKERKQSFRATKMEKIIIKQKVLTMRIINMLTQKT